MKKIFFFTATLLVLFLLFFLLPSDFYPAEESVSDEIIPAASFMKKEGLFSYINGYTDIYFYDDRYFFNNSAEYNPHLATMSLCLSLSAFSVEEETGDTDFSNNFSNVKKLLCEELGYKNFSANEWYSKAPTSDSIAVCAATRKLFDEAGAPYTIIAVAVRGGGYGKEWISNFTLGESGEAQGFSDAKEQVLDFLKDYISDNKTKISKNVKFWITGYSRGAATANLAAGAISDAPDMFGDDISFSEDDIYAYCFATPMGALQENVNSSYENIWNVINRNDPVPYLAMSNLGFTRLGNNHFFPDSSTHPDNFSSMQETMEKYYREFPTFSEIGEYSIDEFSTKKINILYLTLAAISKDDSKEYLKKVIEDDSENRMTQGEFLESAISVITTENIKDRVNYVAEFEGGIRTIIDTVYGSVFSEYPQKTTKQCFNIFMEKLKSPMSIVRILYGIFESDNSPSRVLTELLVESMGECGIEISSEKIPEIENFAKASISLVAKFTFSHPNLTSTLINNIERIGSGHNYELYFAWLKAEDSNYTSSPIS